MLLVLLVTGVPESTMNQDDTLESLLCLFAVGVSAGGLFTVAEAL